MIYLRNQKVGIQVIMIMNLISYMDSSHNLFFKDEDWIFHINSLKIRFRIVDLIFSGKLYQHLNLFQLKKLQRNMTLLLVMLPKKNLEMLKPYLRINFSLTKVQISKLKLISTDSKVLPAYPLQNFLETTEVIIIDEYFLFLYYWCHFRQSKK